MRLINLDNQKQNLNKYLFGEWQCVLGKKKPLKKWQFFYETMCGEPGCLL